MEFLWKNVKNMVFMIKFGKYSMFSLSSLLSLLFSSLNFFFSLLSSFLLSLLSPLPSLSISLSLTHSHTHTHTPHEGKNKKWNGFVWETHEDWRRKWKRWIKLHNIWGRNACLDECIPRYHAFHHIHALISLEWCPI